MISMKDIAQQCGTSVATVSKALNGQPDIGQATRERICKVAEEMGYMANAAARALKTNRSYNIGVLFFDERLSGLSHEYFSTILESFKTEVEKYGYDITFINRHVGTRESSYLQHCIYRALDGVIIVCVNFNDPQVIELINSKIPTVAIDCVFKNHTSVMSDNISGIKSLVRYVHSKGHRKIAFIHGEDTAVTHDRLTGFKRVCSELGFKPDSKYIRQGRYHDSENSRMITKELLELHEPPTCILFPDDISCLGGLNAIYEAGLRVPEDISVVGYDGINLSQVLTPRLTTFHQDSKMLGSTAAQLLIRLIEKPESSLPQQAVIPGWLIEGQSVANV